MEKILGCVDKDKKEETATTVPSGKRSGKVGEEKAGKNESGKPGKKGTTVPTDGATEKEGFKPGQTIVEKILCHVDKDKKEGTVTTAPSRKLEDSWIIPRGLGSPSCQKARLSSGVSAGARRTFETIRELPRLANKH